MTASAFQSKDNSKKILLEQLQSVDPNADEFKLMDLGGYYQDTIVSVFRDKQLDPVFKFSYLAQHTWMSVNFMVLCSNKNVKHQLVEKLIEMVCHS